MKKRFSLVLLAILCALSVFSFAACAADRAPAEPNVIDGRRLTGQNVKWLGRTEYDEASGIVNCYYTATGFEVRFIGTRLDVTYFATNTESDKNRPYFFAEIDGGNGEGKRFSLTESPQTVTVAEGLAQDRVHTVKVLKESEPENSLTSVSRISTDGEFIKPQKSSALKFQILGGSGISGHGCLGAAGEEWSTFNSSSLSGFGYLAAQAFGAECQFVSNSGMGLKWGYRGVENLTEAYEATGLVAEYHADGSTKAVSATQSRWDHTSWVPDVVIVNIGGNDWNAHISLLGEGTAERTQAEARFKESVTALLNRIHALYPSAYVAWTCNSKTSGNGALAKDAIDGLPYRAQIAVIEIDNTKDGADNHASAATQAKNGGLVAKEIAAAFGIKETA